MKSRLSKSEQLKVLQPFAEAPPPARGINSAFAEEVLRAASEGEPTGFENWRADLWLQQALRDAVAALDPGFDYECDSLQRRLLTQLDQKSPRKSVWALFEKAKAVRGAALMDIACRALTGTPYQKIKRRLERSTMLGAAIHGLRNPGLFDQLNVLSDSPAHSGSQGGPGSQGFSIPPADREDPSQKRASNELLGGVSPQPAMERELTPDAGEDPQTDVDPRTFALRQLAVSFPREILPSQAFRETMDMQLLGGRGVDWIIGLATEIQNANRRSTGPKSKELELELTMTIHFTNPQHPLWMASSEALESILSRQFGLSNVTKEGAKRMRSRKLRLDSPYPIVGFSTFADGRQIFELSQGLQG